MNKYKGSLELNWINKDKSLLYEIDEEEGMGVKPVWVEKDDIRVSEPRIQKLKGEYGDPDNENMLIKGDNLLALRTLVEEFKNRDEKDKVKCIYIDPPFNTGSAFEHYDDNLEHSQWLTMIRDRMVLLKELMRDDGVVFVEIDDTEQAYLKVIMDEIFGRKNCVLSIVIKRSAATGHKAINPTPINVCEFVHIYGRKKSSWEYIRLFVKRQKYDNAYNKWITNIDDDYSVWKFHPLSDICARKMGYSSSRIAKKKLGKEAWEKNYISFALKNANNVIRFAQPNYSGVGQAARDLIDISRVDDSIVYLLEREKHPDMYFYKGDRILFLKDKVENTPEGPMIVEPLTNLWIDIPWQGIAKEGGVKFVKSKKPEKLIKRILEMSTEPGDLVLDSFLGSGTTATVAHKMGRRWIGIELGKHAETLCIPRLKRVVSGEDQTGISKELNWQGGGGFRYYEVGESVIKDLDMNWDMTLEEMSRAVFMNFDFSLMEGEIYRPQGCEDDFHLGKQNGGIAICLVTKGTHIFRRQELNKLIKDLKKVYGNQKITIFTNMGVAVKRDELGERLDVKKIPESILKKYRMV